METILTLLVPVLVGASVIRAVLLPLRWSVRLAVHAALGFACLWLLNLASWATDIAIPVNAVTVVTAGTLGLPGIALLVLLALV